MCISPIKIRNPNLGLARKGLNFLKDCTSQYISIPCGHCVECIRSKQMQLVQRVVMESMKNVFFFATLTYNNDMLPRVQVNDYSIRYADISDLQKMFKRIRKDNAFGVPFRYFAVSELGSKRGRPHFHVLFLLDKQSFPTYNDLITQEKLMYDTVLKYWSRNIGSKRSPVYVPCCTYKAKWRDGRLVSNYDLHYVNPALSQDGISDVGFYVLKYMLKPSQRTVDLQRALRLNLSEEDYFKVWSLVKPRYIKSHDFGLSRDPDVQDYLRKSVTLSKQSMEFPCFFHPVTGNTFPLSRFYVNKGSIYNVQDALDFYYNSNSATFDNSDPNRFRRFLKDSADLSKVVDKIDSFERTRVQVDDKGDSQYFDEIYE